CLIQLGPIVDEPIRKILTGYSAERLNPVTIRVEDLLIKIGGRVNLEAVLASIEGRFSKAAKHDDETKSRLASVLVQLGTKEAVRRLVSLRELNRIGAISEAVEVTLKSVIQEQEAEWDEKEYAIRAMLQRGMSEGLAPAIQYILSQIQLNKLSSS